MHVMLYVFNCGSTMPSCSMLVAMSRTVSRSGRKLMPGSRAALLLSTVQSMNLSLTFVDVVCHLVLRESFLQTAAQYVHIQVHAGMMLSC
jgi:hypothetical protein